MWPHEYCDVVWPEIECHLPEAHLWYLQLTANQTDDDASASSMAVHAIYNSTETLHSVWHIMLTIVPVLFYFAIARILLHLLPHTASGKDSVQRFVLEFILIAIPTVVTVNVANAAVDYIMAAMTVGLLLLIWRMRCWEKARTRTEFKIGKRPCMLTLARATINFITALCILAIDFESFPKRFRKSRRFGAGLMDVGIGLFVFAMGTVSKRPRSTADLKRLVRMVAPVLFLGIARTVVIVAIDYNQDEHEYGVHLNAFFTLGLTKLFGALLSAVAINDTQILLLGIVTLVFHEISLQLGISDFVMNSEIERKTFLTANREGLCSLPGFVGIYLISMYIGQWLQTSETLNFNQFMRKLKGMTVVSVTLWWLVVVSVFCVGIARVTCNFGYATWILSIALTMTLLFMFVFDLVLNTLWPAKSINTINAESGEAGELLQLKSTGSKKILSIPTLVEAVNMNGLIFFLLANVLTGGVNIFLKPEERSNLESILILSLYMFIATGFAYILYRFKIRIA